MRPSTKAKFDAMQSLTRVRLAFVCSHTNVWLRFGRVLKERIVDSHIRDVYFTPHAIFAIVTRCGTTYGAAGWRVDVLRAVAIRERASQVPNVEPGAEILLRVSGESKVIKTLALFESIEASGIQLTAISPDRWRCAHNRLAANQDIGIFNVEANAAFHARRNLTS
jgi:hypothetical protein